MDERLEQAGSTCSSELLVGRLEDHDAGIIDQRQAFILRIKPYIQRLLQARLYRAFTGHEFGFAGHHGLYQVADLQPVILQFIATAYMVTGIGNAHTGILKTQLDRRLVTSTQRGVDVTIGIGGVDQ